MIEIYNTLKTVFERLEKTQRLPKVGYHSVAFAKYNLIKKGYSRLDVDLVIKQLQNEFPEVYKHHGLDNLILSIEELENKQDENF